MMFISAWVCKKNSAIALGVKLGLGGISGVCWASSFFLSCNAARCPLLHSSAWDWSKWETSSVSTSRFNDLLKETNSSLVLFTVSVTANLWKSSKNWGHRFHHHTPFSQRLLISSQESAISLTACKMLYTFESSLGGRAPLSVLLTARAKVLFS
jgi:hypothetical protein